MAIDKKQKYVIVILIVYIIGSLIAIEISSSLQAPFIANIITDAGFPISAILLIYLAKISKFSPTIQAKNNSTKQNINSTILSNLSVDEIFERAKIAAKNMGLKYVNEDASIGTILFKRGASTYSMGEDLIVNVKQQGENKAISINSSIKFYGVMAQMRAQKDVDAMYQALAENQIK